MTSEKPAPGEHAEGNPADHHGPNAMEDTPPVRAIGIAIVVTVVGIFVIVLGVRELFRHLITAEIQAKVLSQTSSELRELRASEEQKLTRYQWVSKKDGVVRIPLSRAIALTVDDYRRPLTKASPAASASPAEAAPPSAPSGSAALPEAAPSSSGAPPTAPSGAAPPAPPATSAGAASGHPLPQ